MRPATPGAQAPASEPASPEEWPARSAFAPGRGGVTQKKGDDDDIISGCPTARAGKRRATAATLNSPAPPGLGGGRTLARRAAGLGSHLNGQISAFSQPRRPRPPSSHGPAAILHSLTPAPADVCSSCSSLPAGRRETVVEGIPMGIMTGGNSRKL